MSNWPSTITVYTKINVNVLLSSSESTESGTPPYAPTYSLYFYENDSIRGGGSSGGWGPGYLGGDGAPAEFGSSEAFAAYQNGANSWVYFNWQITLGQTTITTQSQLTGAPITDFSGKDYYGDTILARHLPYVWQGNTASLSVYPVSESASETTVGGSLLTGSDEPYYVQDYGFPNSNDGSLGSTPTSKPTVTVVSSTDLALSHASGAIVDTKYVSWQLSHLNAALPSLFSSSVTAWNGTSGTVDWVFNPKSSDLDPYIWEGETATFTVPVVVTAPVTVTAAGVSVATDQKIQASSTDTISVKGAKDNLHFAIVEGSGGYGTLTAYNNGLPLVLNNNGTNTVQIAFDPTMPLLNGAYNMWYEIEGDDAPCLHFTYNFPDGRTGINLHQGNSPGDSAGCIVFGNVNITSGAKTDAYSTLLAVLNDLVAAENPTEIRSGYYNFTNPITATVTGCSQPLLSIVPQTTNVIEGSKAKITLKIGGSGTPAIIDRDVEVYFKILGLPLGQASLVTGAKPEIDGDYLRQFKGDYEITIAGKNSWLGGSSATGGTNQASFTINTTGLSVGTLKIQIDGYDELGYPWQGGGTTKEYTPAKIGSQPMLKGVLPATIKIEGKPPSAVPESATSARPSIVSTGSVEVIGAMFGNQTITDFAGHDTASSHDIISLPTSDFANFAALLHDASNVGGNLVLTAKGGDTLTIDGLNKGVLATLPADFTFHS